MGLKDINQIPKENPGLFTMLGNVMGGDGHPRSSSMHLGQKGFSSKLYLPVLIPCIALVVYGLIVIWSASLSIPKASFLKQFIGVGIGLAGAGFIWHYDYRNLDNATIMLLCIDVFLMISPKLPGIGYHAKGIDGWVQIPGIGFRFQPAEPAKIVTIILMAGLAAQYNGKIESFRDYVKLCAVLCVPFIAILAQPDLGTGLIVLISGATIIIVCGAKKAWVLPTIALIVLGSTIIITMSLTPGMPQILKPYQLNRLLVFADPSLDPSGSGFNLQQAQIAVGSGGIVGKGIGNATQAGHGFLPEAHTDFVFALLSEEFGFLGATVLLFLFGWLIFATLGLALKVESPYAKLILVGIVAMWSFQVLENIGMCIGLMPITGIPLPFISYGSSSMVTQLAAVGLVQSIWYHRKKSA